MSMSREVALNLYERAVAELPDIPRKGKANPYTSLNGHMFSFLDKQNVVSLRFGKEELQAFMADNKTTKSMQYGSEMREFALVPEALLKDHKAFVRYLKRSLAYVKGLEPK